MIVNRYVNGEKTEKWQGAVVENTAVKAVLAEAARRAEKAEDAE